jgi:hypothetical protein|tara:strand:+ start:175 stop:525 length:351 start_codon:yes stop_codon:yes gene_type:complete
MKKLIFLISFSILFQSCLSYQTIDYNNIAVEKNQKFKVLGVGGKNIKGRLVSKNEQTMILEKNGQLQKISVDKIYEVKVRKFSILKTFTGIGGTYALVIAAVIVLILALGEFPALG